MGCNPAKIVVHYSAINCELFSYNYNTRTESDPVHIVTTGRLIEKKGIQYAIKAIATIIKKYPNLKLKYTIIGEGPLKEQLATLISSLDLQNNIQLKGSLVQAQVFEILKEAHIFVLPSVQASDGNSEGIPNALKEAMAMGIPVVSTYHSGVPELIENEVKGYLVQEKNVNELANKIESLINNPDRAIEMGLMGHEKINDYFENNFLNDKLERILYE